ncbi:MAG: C-terminal helicase domain-containing protein, partial [Chloroflexota bacterium]
ASAGTNIVQGLIVVSEDDKRDALLAVIKSQEVKNAIVFCNRKRDVAALHTVLKKHGLNAGALHGDMSQPARTETLEKFKAGEIQILVASDVAARGLDVADMSHVFNYDVPFSPEDYVHRIGRTGRAGKVGHSFTLAAPHEGGLIEAIEKLIGTTIPRIEVPGLETAVLEAGDGRRRGRGGRGGRGAARPGAAAGDKPRGPRREPRAPREHREPRPEAPLAVSAEPQAAVEAPHEASHEVPHEVPREANREPRPERAPRERRPERERAPREHAPREPRAERAAQPPRERQSERRPERSSERRPEHRRDRDDGGPAPKGLGDHVPAFLARPPR